MPSPYPAADQHAKPREIEQQAGTVAPTKKVAAADNALFKFDAQILELLSKVDRRNPERFSKTAVAAAQLARLGKFLVALAELKSAENAESLAYSGAIS
jgi:hypothetical protein